MKPVTNNFAVKHYLLNAISKAGTGVIASAGVVIIAGSLFAGYQAMAKTLVTQAMPPIEIIITEIPGVVTDIEGFTGIVQTLAVSPDGKILLVGAGGETINAIDLEQQKIIYAIAADVNDFSNIVFSPDGELFAIAEDEEISLFSTATGEWLQTLEGHPKKVNDLAMSPDGKTLVSVSIAARDIRIWSLGTGALIGKLTQNIGPTNSVEFTPDGSLFITGSIAQERTIKFWDANSFELVQTSTKQPGYINDLAVSSNSILVAAVRNYVKVWDLLDISLIQQIKGPNLEINAIAVSPDGNYVATANKEGNVMVFDTRTGQKTLTLEGHQGWVRTVAFSPDGTKLFSGAEDKIVKIWPLSP